MIFIIGAGRSGTTYLANLLGELPNTTKLPELNYIWMRGRLWSQCDYRSYDEATDNIKNKIRSYINKNYHSKNKILIEKTPSNCFRIGFLEAIYPNSKYIHIVRDGRAASLSSLKAFYGANAYNQSQHDNISKTKEINLYIQSRIHQLKTKLKHKAIPTYALFPCTIRRGADVVKRILNDTPPLWGARFPGYNCLLSRMTPIEVAGIQWRESINYALAGFSAFIEPKRVLTVKYEELIEEPTNTMKKIISFLEFDISEDYLLSIYSTIKKSKNDWNTELNENKLKLLLSHIKPTLNFLGYE